MKAFQSIESIVKETANGAVSAESRTRQTLANIRATDSALNAFLTLDEERAIMAAQEVDACIAAGGTPGPLAGVPVAVKDQLVTKDLETTCGSGILRGFIPPYDATAVARLRAAGAIVVGKTNQDEFGMGSSTETSFKGPTHNPWNLACTAGGSSGGSATSVGSGQVCVALGTDTGGSIRQPASFTGVVGLKPTYGRVSRYGAIAYASSLDQIGPMGRCVEDVARVLGVIAGQDSLDSTSSSVAVPDFVVASRSSVQGKRVGVPKGAFGEGVSPEVEQAVRTGLERLVSAGVELVDIPMPHAKYSVPTYYILAMAEASSNLSRYDGVRYGFRAPSSESLEQLMGETRAQGFGEEVKRRIMLGTFTLSSGYVDAYYRKAQQVRTLIRQDFTRAFTEYGVDAIATPTAPCTAWKLGEKLEDPLEMYRMDVFTTGCNLAGLPGISIPCGMAEGLPVGLQLVGAAFDEGGLLALAKTHEERYGEAFALPTVSVGEAT